MSLLRVYVQYMYLVEELICLGDRHYMKCTASDFHIFSSYYAVLVIFQAPLGVWSNFSLSKEGAPGGRNYLLLHCLLFTCPTLIEREFGIELVAILCTNEPIFHLVSIGIQPVVEYSWWQEGRDPAHHTDATQCKLDVSTTTPTNLPHSQAIADPIPNHS